MADNVCWTEPPISVARYLRQSMDVQFPSPVSVTSVDVQFPSWQSMDVQFPSTQFPSFNQWMSSFRQFPSSFNQWMSSFRPLQSMDVQFPSFRPSVILQSMDVQFPSSTMG
jgi:hypothetical protein